MFGIPAVINPIQSTHVVGFLPSLQDGDWVRGSSGSLRDHSRRPPNPIPAEIVILPSIFPQPVIGDQPKLTIHASALYAHKINTLFWHDIDNAGQFGFAKGQVTPFTIPTPDGESLYAWHVLPIDAYLRNSKALSENKRPHGPVPDFTKTLPFEILSSRNPPARVVINCELPPCKPATL